MPDHNDNQNDNFSLEDLNKALLYSAWVEVGAGRVVDLSQVSVLALTVHEAFKARPELFDGSPELHHEDEVDTPSTLDLRSAAEWACTETAFARLLPDLIEKSGACSPSTKPKYALPHVISALARCEPFVSDVAERFEARVDQTELREEKLLGYLERHGYRLLHEVLQKASTREESPMLMTRQLRVLIIDHHLETSIGLHMPTSGLSYLQLGDVIEFWLLEHEDRIQQILGVAPPFGAEHE